MLTAEQLHRDRTAGKTAGRRVKQIDFFFEGFSS
jgi:hypothetical protein